MSVDYCFSNTERDERMLQDHGFSYWPNTDELTRKACDIEDALQALAGAFGAQLIKDFRGRWRVVSTLDREENLP